MEIIRKFIGKQPTQNQRIIIGTYLILIVLIRINFLYIPAIRDADTLPLISHHNDIYVFGGPSHLRFSPDQRIRPADNTPIDSYELELAKNEYETFQLININGK